MAQWFLRRRLLNFIYVFSLLRSCIISSLKRAYAFIGINLNPLDSRMLCANFYSNWPSDFWEEGSKNFVNVFSVFCYYLPLKRGMALHLKKAECPSTKNTLCQFWLKLSHCFRRRRLKCEKITDRRTHRQSDGRSDKLTWAFSSGELKENLKYRTQGVIWVLIWTLLGTIEKQ